MASPSIVADLADMLPDTLTAQPGSLDAFGEWTASGAALTPDCYIEGETRLVRDQTGQEVVSSVQVYVGSVNGLDVDGYRYTLPARFVPSGELRAIGVQQISDDGGANYEVVLLP